MRPAGYRIKLIRKVNECKLCLPQDRRLLLIVSQPNIEACTHVSRNLETRQRFDAK